MAMIALRGRRLEYEAQPTDVDTSLLTVLFLHGTGGDREDWRGQLDASDVPGTRVALELPGHGRSEPPGESTVDAYARWVHDFVDALGFERVMLVGNSLGSAITQRIALSPPPWLVAIGLVGAGARLRVHPAFVEGVLQDKDKALAGLAQWALSAASDPALHEEIQKKFQRASAELIHGDLSACNEFDVISQIGTVALPTWIAVGADDMLTPMKYSIFLHEAIEASVLTVIPAAGHLVMMEKPVEFNARLAAFIAETFPDAQRPAR
jgi:pimeloyl-ACP methyl ester carboxylesterase